MSIATVLGSDLIRWLKDYGSNGTWTCQQGSGNATAGTPGERPTQLTSAGGQTYPDFNRAGTADILSASAISGFTYNSAHHFVMGCAVNIETHDTTNGNFLWTGSASDVYVTRFGWVSGYGAGTFDEADVTSGWHSVIFAKNGSSGVVTLYIDGVAQGSTGTGTMGSDWDETMSYGSRGFADEAMEGGLLSLFFARNTTTAYSQTTIDDLHDELMLLINGGGGGGGDIIDPYGMMGFFGA